MQLKESENLYSQNAFQEVRSRCFLCLGVSSFISSSQPKSSFDKKKKKQNKTCKLSSVLSSVMEPLEKPVC